MKTIKPSITLIYFCITSIKLTVLKKKKEEEERNNLKIGYMFLNAYTYISNLPAPLSVNNYQKIIIENVWL